MFQKMRLLLLIPLVMAVGVFLHAQTDLTGFWVFRVPTGDGNFRESYLDLKQNGDQITGRVLQGRRESPITTGTFSDGKLHFVTTFHGSNNQTRETVYEGTVNGDKITLTSQVMGRSPVEGVLERS